MIDEKRVSLRRPRFGLSLDAVDGCEHRAQDICVANHGDLLEPMFFAPRAGSQIELETLLQGLRPGQSVAIAVFTAVVTIRRCRRGARDDEPAPKQDR